MFWRTRAALWFVRVSFTRSPKTRQHPPASRRTPNKVAKARRRILPRKWHSGGETHQTGRNFSSDWGWGGWRLRRTHTLADPRILSAACSLTVRAATAPSGGVQGWRIRDAGSARNHEVSDVTRSAHACYSRTSVNLVFVN